VCRLFCGAIAAATAAVIGTLLTTVGKPAVDAYFRTALRDNFILTNNGSAAYSGWANSSDPTAGVVYSSYVVYNVTNPDEILAGGKPLLVEMPAITYYYNNMKFDVEWDAESNNGEAPWGELHAATSQRHWRHSPRLPRFACASLRCC